MPDVLPQQRLLLELLVMSGDIAVADDISDTILERTIEECEKKGWVRRSVFGAGFHKTTITEKGRVASNIPNRGQTKK
ncbi:hypothetical protein MTBPR1_30338 [Candidatus Terasakiella magnetica]|uniref:Uncharacterized protein n=1 Tax=Candidatus Terasakiella magnetica TaxID=1867952 RepID=A0A1C3RI70_9PROT|nr:hypothetical protein [Candidatus Terasakiella magnetica]SCA56968.1 hypothetical protein MTBPR1_30338 [Candidatus Terasakiella magnetica]